MELTAFNPARALHKSVAILVALLMASSLIVGLIPITPAYGQTWSFEVSQTQLGDKNVIKVTIVDPDIAAGEFPTVHISFGGQVRNVFMSKNTLGQFVAFIADEDATATIKGAATDEAGDPAANEPDSFIVNVNGANAPNYPDNPGALAAGGMNPDMKATVTAIDADDDWVVVQLYNFGTADTATLTYLERGATIDLSLGETNANLTGLNRDKLPPAGKVTITVSDPTENLDPTAVDTVNYANMEIQVIGTTLIKDTFTFTETEANSGVFEATINMADVERVAGTDATAVADGRDADNVADNNLSDDVLDGDVVTFIVPDDDDPTVKPFADISVVIKPGTLALSATEVNYFAPLTVNVTDPDANLDAESEDTLDVLIEVDYKRAGADDITFAEGLNLKLEETDVDTGVFTGTFLLAIEATSDKNAGEAAGDNTNQVTVGIAPADAREGATVTFRYDDNFPAAALSEQSASLSTVSAQISLDRDIYNQAFFEEVVITLTEPDANDDPDRIETLTIDVDAGAGDPVKTAAGVTIGQLTVALRENGVFNDKDLQAAGIGDIILVETGRDTGIFKSSPVDLTGIVTDWATTDRVRVTYADSFDGSEATATSQVAVTIQVGELSANRDFLPLAVNKDVSVTITLVDADENVDPFAKDQANLKVDITAGDGTAVWFENLATAADDEVADVGVNVDETGLDTSTFELTLTYKVETNKVTVTIAGTNYQLEFEGDVTVAGRFMADAKLTVSYPADDVSITIPFVAHTAQIDVNATLLNVGDVITITVTEPDANLDPDTADTVAIDLQTAEETVKLVDSAGLAVDPAANQFILTETGDDTGVFSATLQIGVRDTDGNGVPDDPEDIVADYAIVYYPTDQVFDPTTTKFKVGASLSVSYTDSATAASFYGTRLAEATDTASFSLNSHTAQLEILGLDDVASPFEYFTIRLTDPDLILHEEDEVFLTRIRAASTYGETLDQTELAGLVAATDATAYGNGTFTWEFRFWISASFTGAATDADPTVDDQGAIPGVEIAVGPSDTVYIFYIDEVDATGSSTTLTQTITVHTTTGEVTLDKSAYNIGERMALTINDPDQNRNPDVVESVQVTVTSDTYPAGVTIELTETGTDTGVFTTQIELVTGLPEANEIQVSIGDTVTIEYVDPFNAAGEQETLTETAVVGIRPELPVTVEQGQITDELGNVLEVVDVGDLVLVQGTFTNEDIVDVTVTLVVRIDDELGVTVHLGVATITVAPGQTATLSVSWVPQAPGTYTVTITAWDSLAARTPLTQTPQTFTVEVTGG
jgi:hypothetical protein